MFVNPLMSAKNNLNQVVEHILNMHSVNLLWGGKNAN